MADIDVISNLRLGEVIELRSGSKIVAIQPAHREISFKDPVRAPFGASTFDGSTSSKLNLTLRLHPESEILKIFQTIDEWTVVNLVASSNRIWGKCLSEASVRELYCSPLKCKDGYEPLLRTKLLVDGNKACHFWTPEGNSREMPTDWSNLDLRVNLELTNLWMMGRNIGWVITARDVQITEGQKPVRVSPFSAIFR